MLNVTFNGIPVWSGYISCQRMPPPATTYIGKPERSQCSDMISAVPSSETQVRRGRLVYYI